MAPAAARRERQRAGHFSPGAVSPAAERYRRYRARKRSGKRIVGVEVDYWELVDALCGCGKLQQWDEGNGRLVAAALGRVVADWIHDFATCGGVDSARLGKFSKLK
jgi:hypothetical protein